MVFISTNLLLSQSHYDKNSIEKFVRMTKVMTDFNYIIIKDTYDDKNAARLSESVRHGSCLK
jgi:hypothetical protein